MAIGHDSESTRRFMWAVQALAVNVGVQLRLFPEFADPADELELDQQETQAAFLADWGALLSPSQREAIGELDAQLESMGGSDNTHLWSVEALASAPEWAQVRARAARVLREMGWRLETPPMNRATYVGPTMIPNGEYPSVTRESPLDDAIQTMVDGGVGHPPVEQPE